MRNALTFVFVVASVVPVQTAAAAEKPTRQDVGNRTIVRKVYDVARDARGNMRLDPLPFAKDTKGLPAEFPMGTNRKPEIDNWTAAGYVGDVVLEDPGTTEWGLHAVNAGLCKAGTACRFSFTYVLSVQKNYAADKLDDIGIRYAVTQEGYSTEGLIWGTENNNQRYLREKSAWRKATDPERERMWYAVNACSSYHAAQVAAVQGP